MCFQPSSSIRTLLSNALLLHKSHCASVKCLRTAKPTVSQPRKHLHFAGTDTAESCGQMMSKRIAYGPVHSASFCTERRGVKVWQKIPLGSQLLFIMRWVACLSSVLKTKLRQSWFQLFTASKQADLDGTAVLPPGLLYIPEHDSSPGLASGLRQSHTKASRDELKAKGPTTLS